jgi:hypothetical protein
MSTKKVLIIGGIVVSVLGVLAVIVGVSIWGWTSSFYDKANAGAIAVESRDKEAQAVYDKTWKTISQKAQISDKYSEDFKQMFIGATEARSKDKQQMGMLWIQEQNPALDPSLFKELGQAIEANRAEYLSIVKTQISVAQEHNQLVTSSSGFFPCMILRVVGGRAAKACDTLTIRQVTSSKTQESFKSGEENSVDLFNKAPASKDSTK